MKKIRYEVDPHNRLVLKKGGTKSRLTRFRRVLDGRFRSTADNTLLYHVKTPLPSDKDIPHQIRLKGAWSFNKNHDLQLTLNKWGRQTFGDKITLHGRITEVKKKSLSFTMTTLTKEGIRSTYLFKLHGSWQADKRNRLTFKVRKERGRYDSLIFDGVWDIHKAHHIVYRYKKAQLIRKLKKIHTLVLKGHWVIKDRARITYRVEGSTDSAFNFKAGAGLFTDKYIKYAVGIRVSRRSRPVKRTITLFGSWKLDRKRGLLFEIKYKNKEIHAIVFGAHARLTAKDTVLFKLQNDVHKDMKTSLELSHKILRGDGQVFLRLLKKERDVAIYAGLAARW